jgi:hypothetical protein
MTLALLAVTGIVAWRRGGRPWPQVELPLLLGALSLIAVALALRRHPSYFAFGIGDMGGYLNGANQIAAGQRGVGIRPQGFTVFLAGCHALLGRAGTVSGLPAIGVMFLLGAVALGKLIGLRTLALGILGLIVAVHPVTVWFSLFPVSEVLYSVLLIAAVYFLVRARSDRSRAYAVVSGLFMGVMLIVRINAMLLAPLLVVVLFASAVADDDDRYRIQRWVTVVALASLSLAYAYDIHYFRQYMKTQLHGRRLPALVGDTVDRLGLLDFPDGLFVVAGLFALVLVIAGVMRRSRVVRVRSPARGFWRAATASAVALSALGLAVTQHRGVEDGLGRWGPAVLTLAAIGITLLVLRPDRYLDGGSGLFMLLVAGAYALLFALRHPHVKGAIYFLYWHRYLYSEVLPVALVFVGIAVHALIGIGVDSRPRRPALRAAALAGLIALVALAVIPGALQTRRTGIARQALYGDVYGTLSRLDRLTRVRGDLPIVYSGLSAPPAGWPFPNTVSAFARPLAESFDRTVVRTGAYGATKVDRVLSPGGARIVLAAAGYGKGYLIDLHPVFTPRFPDTAATRYVGSVDYVAPILRRNVVAWSERFTYVTFRFDVYAVR